MVTTLGESDSVTTIDVLGISTMVAEELVMVTTPVASSTVMLEVDASTLATLTDSSTDTVLAASVMVMLALVKSHRPLQ